MGFLDQMKGFAGRVGDTVEKGAKSVSENSKKMAEKSRLKKEISQLETEVNSAYASIGKVFFERLVVNPEPECQNAVDAIASKNARIEQLNRILATLEDKISCPNCGAGINKTQRFCDKCGAKVEFIEEVKADVVEEVKVEETVEVVDEKPVETVTATAETKVCSECGQTADINQMFCEHCGKKF
ncbi:MAG: zinc ribbon domain-containing protein [Ruminococcus sp.]|nr:zinc ribbon domain-containing protein [Ruminococcus sp.]